MNPFTSGWYEFQDRRLTRTVLPYTLVSPARIHNLCRLARRIEKERIPGDVIECGVCNGGTAAVLARFATRSRMNRTVWLLDSFQGMPDTTQEDGVGFGGDAAESHVGREVGDPERVKEVLKKVRTKMSRVRILPGWFQNTFSSVTATQIAFLNIDADWYESVKLCLSTFYDLIVPNGFVSFDDYGYWPGCKRAVDEFLLTRQLPYKLIQVDYTAYWFQKT